MKKMIKKLKKYYKKNPSMIILPCIIGVLIIISLTLIIAFSSKKDNDFNPDDYKDIKFNISAGEFKNLNIKKIDGMLIAEIKVKIHSQETNQQTIEMNYKIAEDIINDKQSECFDEIMYWAVAEMESKTEAKVMSFDLTRDTINKIRKNNIPPSEYGDYVQNLYIFPPMRE